MTYVVPWLFIAVHCSGPLFIVSRTTASPFTNCAKYCGVCQLQKNNPNVLEYFEFATSSDKLLIQQEKLGVAEGFKIMYLPSITKAPRGAFRTMSSI